MGVIIINKQIKHFNDNEMFTECIEKYYSKSPGLMAYPQITIYIILLLRLRMYNRRHR